MDRISRLLSELLLILALGLIFHAFLSVFRYLFILVRAPSIWRRPRKFHIIPLVVFPSEIARVGLSGVLACFRRLLNV